MRFNKNDTALVVIDPQNHVLSEKDTVTMKSVSLANADQNDKTHHLSAELASSVYQLALRETKPQSWLDLELGLWKAISNKLEARGTEERWASQRTSSPLPTESRRDSANRRTTLNLGMDEILADYS